MEGVAKIIPKVIDIIARFFAKVSAVTILVMAILVSVDVVGRKFFHFSTMVADEFSGYMLAAIVFLGLAYTTKQDGHVRMELLYISLSPRFQKTLDFIFNFLGAVYGVLLTWQVTRMALTSYLRNSLAPTPARTPIFIPQSFIVLGMITLTFQMWLSTFMSLLQLRKPNTEREKGVQIKPTSKDKVIKAGNDGD